MKLEAGKFYGETAQTLSASSFHFTEKAYSPVESLPFHAHELAHFCFVLSGTYEERIGTRNFERKPTALVYYPPDISHSERHFSDGRHFLVEIDVEGLDRVREYGVCLTDPVILGGESSLRLATLMYKEFAEPDRFSPLALECITTELLIATFRQSSKAKGSVRPKWLDRVTNYLRTNYSEATGLSELAKIADVHPTHLARVFRQFEGCTAGDYIRKVRIESARQRMIGSDQSLAEIALDAGFADQAHFTRSFKRTSGVTPTEFRRMFNSR